MQTITPHTALQLINPLRGALRSEFGLELTIAQARDLIRDALDERVTGLDTVAGIMDEGKQRADAAEAALIDAREELKLTEGRLLEARAIASDFQRLATRTAQERDAARDELDKARAKLRDLAEHNEHLLGRLDAAERSRRELLADPGKLHDALERAIEELR